MSAISQISVLRPTYFVLVMVRNLQELSTDSSQHVRAALASVIMGMAPLLGKVSCGMVISILLFCTYHALTVCRCRYLHMKL